MAPLSTPASGEDSLARLRSEMARHGGRMTCAGVPAVLDLGSRKIALSRMTH